MNQPGEEQEQEVQEPVEDENGMTAEDYERLGEEVPESLRPAEDKGESEEEAETEVGPDTEEEEEAEPTEQEEIDEDKPVPVARFKKIDGQRKEFQERLELLKRDPEEYYRTYPDEKPQQEEEQKKTLPSTQETSMDSVFEGGPYDGKTLGEVLDIDRAYATRILAREEAKRLIAEERQADREKVRLEDSKNKAQQEVNTFAEELGRELSGNKELSLEQLEKDPKLGPQVGNVIDQIITWKSEMGYYEISLQHAYFLMRKDDLLKDALKKGSKVVAKKLNADGVPSVSNKGTSGGGTGWDGYMNMSADQLAKAVESMGDAEASKFLKDAPAKLKEKFPGIPWD